MIKKFRDFTNESEDKEEMTLLYCKGCGEYIGGINPSNLCVGCSSKKDKYESECCGQICGGECGCDCEICNSLD